MRNMSNSLRRRVRIGSAVASTLCIAAAGLALGAPAQASTTKNSCTVTPLIPEYAYTQTGTGKKVLDYKVKVACSQERYVTIQRDRWEHDPWNPDDYLGTSYFYPWIAAGSSKTIHNYRTLVNGEPGEEEVYQSVRFKVWSNDAWSGWTGWEHSDWRGISD